MRILRNSLIYGTLLLGSVATFQNVLAQNPQASRETDALRARLQNIFPSQEIYEDSESGATIVEIRERSLRFLLENIVKINTADQTSYVVRVSGKMDVPAGLAPQIKMAGGRYAALSAAQDTKNGRMPIHIYDARPEELRAILAAAGETKKELYFTGHAIVVPGRDKHS